MANVRVEFYGIARSRAQTEAADVSASTLADVLREIGERFPDAGTVCISDGELATGWLLNINGAKFTRDLTTSVSDGDAVLLIPADAGG